MQCICTRQVNKAASIFRPFERSAVSISLRPYCIPLDPNIDLSFNRSYGVELLDSDSFTNLSSEMVVKPFDNRILDDLCSREQLDLLDSVDRLRSQGIDHYVSLPQFIVCGDQSSGKSSVLEAISGVSFPVKSNLCTRFPTELILRKTPHAGVSVSIVPDHSHNEAERTSLSNFRETLDGFHALPDLIESAKRAMAIDSFGRGFSKDLLRIEISGPDRPHLTIVDLPGLIQPDDHIQSFP
jgi:hypothetical protein